MLGRSVSKLSNDHAGSEGGRENKLYIGERWRQVIQVFPSNRSM